MPREKTIFDTLYEEFTQHFGGGDAFDSEEPAPGPLDFVGELRGWLGDLGRNALARFGVHMLTGDLCTCPRCHGRAVAKCVLCGQPTCLSHGFVNHDAELICDPCVQAAEVPRAKRRKPKKQPNAFQREQARQRNRVRENGRREEARPHFRPSRGPAYDPERIAALLDLGLPPAATPADVHARFRELASKLHPDKFPPPERARAEAAFKKVTAAYETLKAKAA